MTASRYRRRPLFPRTSRTPPARPFGAVVVGFLTLLMGLPAPVFVAPTPARAQDAGGPVMRIAAVVNDDVISVYDIEARTKILIASSGIPNTPEVKAQIRDQVLRSLIDETLKLQAAKALDLTVADTDMQRAIRQVEQQNGIPEGRFEDFLQVANLDRESAMRQIRAEVAWIRTIQARFQNQVEITDEQVDLVLNQLKAAQGKPEHLVLEIFLPVDTPSEDARVRAHAEQLIAEMKRGASFAAVARQFSRSPTAAKGGNLGWVRAGELEPALEKALLAMEPRTLSEPIRSLTGYHIFYLADRRRTAQPEPDKAQLTISQIALPTRGPDALSSADRKAIKDEVAGSVKTCEDFNAIVADRKLPNSGQVGTVPLAKIQQPMRGVLETLEVGQVSDPISVPGGEVLLMLCDREIPGGMPSREVIRKRLRDQRLDLLSNRYLRTLRQQAVIDMRI